MCRGKEFCTELDKNPLNWNKRAPLSIPDWFNDQIEIFINAVGVFLNGEREYSLDLISSIRDEEMTYWYIEHGQMSGKYRKKILNIQRQNSLPDHLRDSVRSPAKYQKVVFIRDGYRCRYCGSRLISQNFMKSFIKKLNSPIFKRGSTNLTTHGVIHVTWPVADHVMPWVLGGKTNLDNLVSSCATCNYGKAGYTCDEIGIENPLKYPPLIDQWDGLESNLEKLKQIPGW